MAPGPAAFAAAVGATPWPSAADLGRQLPVNAPGAASWPITGASFVVLPTGPEQAAKTAQVIKFFDWALHSGRQLSTDVGYVPLPAAAVELIGQLWNEQRLQQPGSVAPPDIGSGH